MWKCSRNGVPNSDESCGMGSRRPSRGAKRKSAEIKFETEARTQRRSDRSTASSSNASRRGEAAGARGVRPVAARHARRARPGRHDDHHGGPRDRPDDRLHRPHGLAGLGSLGFGDDLGLSHRGREQGVGPLAPDAGLCQRRRPSIHPLGTRPSRSLLRGGRGGFPHWRRGSRDGRKVSFLLSSPLLSSGHAVVTLGRDRIVTRA